MAKITRVTQKQFGSSGSSGDFGQFGSKAAGSPTYSKDPATIQSLSQFLSGWASAIITGNIPELEDMNSLFLLAFYQLAYLFQAGIAEFDASTTYYTGSICQVAGVIYTSLQDNNTGNTPSGITAYWTPLQYIDLTSNQTAAGVKTFSGGIVGSGGVTIETRTSDPSGPASGRIWLRTDL